jgi:hypothetical protein
VVAVLLAQHNYDDVFDACNTIRNGRQSAEGINQSFMKDSFRTLHVINNFHKNPPPGQRNGSEATHFTPDENSPARGFTNYFFVSMDGAGAAIATR